MFFNINLCFIACISTNYAAGRAATIKMGPNNVSGQICCLGPECFIFSLFSYITLYLVMVYSIYILYLLKIARNESEPMTPTHETRYPG